ncbi:hypothetical protein OAO54_02320 [Amylibacter sp.]|nr:hypothetical protein [Amylibacter sp.]
MSEADLVYYVQCSEPFPGSEVFMSLTISLEKEIKIIFNNFSKTLRYDIRKVIDAESQFEYHFIENAGACEGQNFISLYNPFCKQKNLRKPNINFLEFLAAHNAMSISYIRDKSDKKEVFCGHLYIRDGDFCRLLYSFHFNNKERHSNPKVYQNLNKFLHFKDIVKFKKIGIRTYDFGGVSQQKTNIDSFKLRFGGVIIKSYSGINKNTKFGSIVLNMSIFLVRIFKQAKVFLP